jgi:predicted branched-subunit amino acid permease
MKMLPKIFRWIGIGVWVVGSISGIFYSKSIMNFETVQIQTTLFIWFMILLIGFIFISIGNSIEIKQNPLREEE